MKKLLSSIVMCLALAACGGKDDFKGYVVGKSFVPAHNTTHYDVILSRPQTHYTPDQYFVFVADSCGVRRFNVYKSTFDSVKKGDFVTPKVYEYGKEADN